MDERRSPFKQIDVTRACKGVVACGLNVGRIEIDCHGKIVIVIQNGNANSSEEINDWDTP
jgi:hypothetical protein